MDVQIEVTLGAQEWDIVLASLEEIPLKMAYVVYTKLQQQLTKSKQVAQGLTGQGDGNERNS